MVMRVCVRLFGIGDSDNKTSESDEDGSFGCQDAGCGMRLSVSRLRAQL
jgi:hypothetical protein